MNSSFMAMASWEIEEDESSWKDSEKKERITMVKLVVVAIYNSFPLSFLAWIHGKGVPRVCRRPVVGC